MADKKPSAKYVSVVTPGPNVPLWSIGMQTVNGDTIIVAPNSGSERFTKLLVETLNEKLDQPDGD